MGDVFRKPNSQNEHKQEKPGVSSVLGAAFAYSFPVFLGYLAIGTAFGLLVCDAGYPWPLVLFMSLWMYAGAGQYIAIGLFTAGVTIWEACLIQLVVNARHVAYGLSMINRLPAGAARLYLIFSLTDETFALLSSLPAGEKPGLPALGKERDRFMLYVSFMDQCYWVAGSLLGAAIGALIPFDLEGIGFALTALFIVLFLEQIFIVLKNSETESSHGKIWIFIISGAAALFAVFLLPERIALLAGMILALVLSSVPEIILSKKGKGKIR